MMKRTLIPLALVVVGILLLLGWGTMAELEAADPSPEPAAATSEPSDGDVQAQPTAASEAVVERESPSAVPADSRFPLPAPTSTGMTGLDNSQCIACHTSQKDLKELAQEPEQKESLSEGEG